MVILKVNMGIKVLYPKLIAYPWNEPASHSQQCWMVETEQGMSWVTPEGVHRPKLAEVAWRRSAALRHKIEFYKGTC
uniref:Uncharacterized protein n=1 Tax=Pyxicephalus adspersus TaxID=30357 RepID=A0AAV2ZYG7_PYXAD|nr:TPA: hypothetical protein GDO54_004287 [Pyxicephalus adspersus]